MSLGVNPNPPQLRRIDVRRDLVSVADLVDICFAHQMDDDGREYVDYLRRSANDPGFPRWVPGCNERVPQPLHGFVWEENDLIVGNLTMIPFFSGGRWIYMIANVSVLPEYRRRGIARRLTEKAIEYIRDHGVHSAWLQVRLDNPGAIELYRSLGFVERARRTTWISNTASYYHLPVPGEVQITSRQTADWEQQERWLEANYPPEVRWNMNLNLRKFSPGIINNMRRFLEGDLTEHWAARVDGNLIGLVTWTSSQNRNLPLLLAARSDNEDLAVRAMLEYARQSLREGKSLVVNYPAGRGVQGFEEAGLKELNTLIWMEMFFR